MNDNLGENHFFGMEDVRIMLEFRGIISKELVKNIYLRQNDLTSEEINSKKTSTMTGILL